MGRIRQMGMRRRWRGSCGRDGLDGLHRGLKGQRFGSSRGEVYRLGEGYGEVADIIQVVEMGINL